MTKNELAYWDLQESKRSNLARETETNRNNVAVENETKRANLAREKETNRSNQVREIQNRLDSERSFRLQTATLDQRKYEFYVNSQLANRQQVEIERSHRESEAVQRQQALTQSSAQQESRRTNLANEQIKRDQLEVTIGQNRVSNSQRAYDLATQRYSAVTNASNVAERNAIQWQSNSISLRRLNQDRQLQLQSLAEQNRHNLVNEEQNRAKMRYDFMSRVVQAGLRTVTSLAKLTASRR